MDVIYDKGIRKYDDYDEIIAKLEQRRVDASGVQFIIECERPEDVFYTLGKNRDLFLKFMENKGSTYKRSALIVDILKQTRRNKTRHNRRRRDTNKNGNYLGREKKRNLRIFKVIKRL